MKVLGKTKKSGKTVKKVPTVASIRAKVFGKAKDDKAFYLSDGRVLHDLSELASSFQDMGNDTFVRHVSGGHNDFGNWVKDVLGDSELADQLNVAKTQVEAEVIVLRRIAERAGGL